MSKRNRLSKSGRAERSQFQQSTIFFIGSAMNSLRGARVSANTSRSSTESKENDNENVIKNREVSLKGKAQYG
jgi:hypothetical protein